MTLVADEAAKGGPRRDPLERPDYVEADLYALRAVSRGDATPDQQRRAMDFLIKAVCGTYDMPYRPGDPHDTAFACGKQWVGQAIVWFLNSAPTKLNAGAPTGDRTP
jgi:hypothetical protein